MGNGFLRRRLIVLRRRADKVIATNLTYRSRGEEFMTGFAAAPTFSRSRHPPSTTLDWAGQAPEPGNSLRNPFLRPAVTRLAQGRDGSVDTGSSGSVIR